MLLGSDTPAVQFRLGPIFGPDNQFLGAVYQANDGRVYALIAQGQTSLAFPVSTSFVPARTVAHLSATLNGVARTAALTITPTLVQSLTLAPATVYNGQGSTATLTLNGPAVPGADPSNPGQTAGGAVILLGSDTPAVQFAPGPIFDSSQSFVGAVYQGQDGRVYAFIPQGLSSLTFLVTTGFVPTETAAHLSATLNGAARTAKLTITPTLVQSLTLAPASVYNGQAGTATLTLSGPAVVGPDPSSPGQTAYGAVVLLGSDSPSAQFSPGPIFDSSQNFVGAVYQGQDGHVYALIAQGQTSLTFPVSTSFVPRPDGRPSQRDAQRGDSDRRLHHHAHASLFTDADPAPCHKRRLLLGDLDPERPGRVRPGPELCQRDGLRRERPAGERQRRRPVPDGRDL